MTSRNHEVRLKLNIDELNKVKRLASIRGLSVPSLIRLMINTARFEPVEVKY